MNSIIALSTLSTILYLVIEIVTIFAGAMFFTWLVILCIRKLNGKPVQKSERTNGRSESIVELRYQIENTRLQTARLRLEQERINAANLAEARLEAQRLDAATRAESKLEEERVEAETLAGGVLKENQEEAAVEAKRVLEVERIIAAEEAKKLLEEERAIAAHDAETQLEQDRIKARQED